MIIIYKFFISDIPNKFYIGATSNLVKRKYTHKSLLKNGKHFNFLLQEAYNSSNDKKLVFEIIDSCEKHKMFEIEFNTIMKIGTDNCYNLNINEKGCGDLISNHPKKHEIVKNTSNFMLSRYAKMSQEQKKILSENALGEKNPNWKGGESVKCSCGNKKAYNAKSCSKCRARNGVNNPFFGKKHSVETIKIISEKNKMKDMMPENAKKVSVNGEVFASATKAANKIGCSVATILNRVRNEKFKEYYFV